MLLACRQPADKQSVMQPAGKPSEERAPDIYATEKARLDSLFWQNLHQASFLSQNSWTTLWIGNLFSREKKDAILVYPESDTIRNVLVLRQTGAGWDTMLTSSVKTWHTENEPGQLEVKDFDDDGMPDLKVIQKQFMHGNSVFDLWHYADGKFSPVEGFDNIVNAEYDPNDKLFYACTSLGCADMRMRFGVFRITAMKVQKLREVECDCCLEQKDHCTIQINSGKKFKVPLEEAYKHVPAFFAERVKAKCRL